MLQTLPDLIQDNVTDAAKRLGVSFTVLVLIKAAHMAGLPKHTDNGHALHRLWQRAGYDSLPDNIKLQILRINEGDFGFDRTNPPMCGECGATTGCHHSH